MQYTSAAWLQSQDWISQSINPSADYHPWVRIQWRIHFPQECKSLGLEGKNVIGEIHELTKSLPQLLFNAAHTIQVGYVKQALQYYQLLVTHVAQELEDSAIGEGLTLLPILTEVEGARLELPAQPLSQPGTTSELNPQ